MEEKDKNLPEVLGPVDDNKQMMEKRLERSAGKRGWRGKMIERKGNREEMLERRRGEEIVAEE